MQTPPIDPKTQVEAAASYVTERSDVSPRVGLMTGTGLGDAAHDMHINAAVAYGEIPHFPVSTVESHPGRLLLGSLNGHATAVMQGRIHLYEGYTPIEVTLPIRLMRALGVETLILTNAAGGLTTRFEPGDIMCISDHINLTGENPLVGPNTAEWGPRFPDMGRAYDPRLRELAETAARKLGIPAKSGVYAGLKGPSLETPAEVRFLQSAGADAVGFSTVQEVIAAVHAGMRVAGFSIITNVHDPNAPPPATLEDIIQVANRTAPALRQLVSELVGMVSDADR